MKRKKVYQDIEAGIVAFKPEDGKAMQLFVLCPMWDHGAGEWANKPAGVAVVEAAPGPDVDGRRTMFGKTHKLDIAFDHSLIQTDIQFRQGRKPLMEAWVGGHGALWIRSHDGKSRWFAYDAEEGELEELLYTDMLAHVYSDYDIGPGRAA